MTANIGAEPESKIDSDFLKNLNSSYFTFLSKNKIDFDLKKVKILSNFIFYRPKLCPFKIIFIKSNNT